MALPKGYGGFIFARSGLGIRHGVVPGNCVGVIDSDYRGEVLVGLHNHSDTAYTIQPGEWIAQLVVLKTPAGKQKRQTCWTILTGEPADLGPLAAGRREIALRMKKNLILLFLLLAGGDVRLSAGSGHPEHPVAYLAFLRADCGDFSR